MESTYHRLFRSSRNKVFGGVCAGIAHFFGMQPFVIRLIFTALFFAGSLGIWFYLLLWFVLPLAEEPAELCELYGLLKSDENLRKFENEK